MKHLNEFLSLMAVLLFICACDRVEEPVEEEQPQGVEAAFRASTCVIGVEDVALTRWEANKDKIGIFASNENGTICANRYYHAFSSTASSRFKSADAEQGLLWEGDSKADVYAYYPFRTSYNDPEAVPCSIPSEQRLALDVFPDIKDFVLYDAQTGVSYADGLPQLYMKPCAAIVKVSLNLNKQVNIKNITVSSSSGPLAFDNGTLNLSDGTVTILEGGGRGYNPYTCRSVLCGN